jgi:hypothetical protein
VRGGKKGKKKGKTGENRQKEKKKFQQTRGLVMKFK